MFKKIILKRLLILLFLVSSNTNFIFCITNEQRFCPFCKSNDTESALNPDFSIIEIKQGMSAIEICNILYKKNIIPSRLGFFFKLIVGNYFGKLKHGKYLLKKDMGPDSVINLISNGLVIIHKVVIPEGLTVFQIMNIIKQNKCLTGNITKCPAEGYLLPGTYFFSENESKKAFLKRVSKISYDFFRNAFEKNYNCPIKLSLNEVLILASIIEKETSIHQEKPLIAGIFMNRLMKRIRLYADPTIIYALTSGKGNLGRELLKTDLKIESSYNTYINGGLPPTPICCSGKATIMATLNPAKTDYVYFVASGNGNHTFSKTLKAHNSAISFASNHKKKKNKHRQLINSPKFSTKIRRR